MGGGGDVRGTGVGGGRGGCEGYRCRWGEGTM